MSANKLPAADEVSFCAKRPKNRSENRPRQEQGPSRSQNRNQPQPEPLTAAAERLKVGQPVVKRFGFCLVLFLAVGTGLMPVNQRGN
jgi:hypothetical protein